MQISVNTKDMIITLYPENSAEVCQLDSMHKSLTNENIIHAAKLQWNVQSISLPIRKLIEE